MYYNSHSQHMEQMHATTLSNYEANMVVAKLRAEVEQVREAILDYDRALAAREHGAIAAHKAVDRIRAVLERKVS